MNSTIRAMALMLVVVSSGGASVVSGAPAAEPATGSPPSPPFGGPDVAVRGTNGVWVIEGRRRTVRLSEASLALEVVVDRGAWRFEMSRDGDLSVRTRGVGASLQLARAGTRTYQPYRTGYAAGVLATLGGFRAGDTPLDLEVRALITLEGEEEELEVELLASDGTTTVRELAWPGAIEPSTYDHTVVPFMQGMLLPVAWPTKVWLYDSLSFGRGLYQPWWGYLRGSQAVLAMLETPDDAGCRFEHPAGGPTRLGPRWVSSLGRWAYPRRLRYCFLEGDHVALAKRYRRHAVATGRFVSLREKIARNPAVARLIGTPVVHTSILYHIQPESSYFNRTNAAANHQLVTFADRAAEVRRLHDRGVSSAYLHLDGWGFRGYDNLHPDVLPPSPEAGGWEGMKRFAEVCADAGFVFAIHDQYRDYYLDAPSYDDRHTVVDEAGKRSVHATWYGGRQSTLCQRLAPGYVRRNHRAILDHGIRLRGAYLDVFSVVPPEECHAPEHPVTRTESLRYRGECLDSVRSWGGVVSSEEPSDWSIPHLDLVHHGPYPLDPNPGSGRAMGIPVPLFNLVYHDALLTPWSLGRGAWGIPQADRGFLHGLGNGGLPYLSLDPDAAELKQVRTMAALHRRVGLLELTGHRFLNESRRRQEFTYADGTVVTVDFEADTWEVRPELTELEQP